MPTPPSQVTHRDLTDQLLPSLSSFDERFFQRIFEGSNSLGKGGNCQGHPSTAMNELRQLLRSLRKGHLL